MLSCAALALGAYLLGAIPFGVIIGMVRGVDVRQHGSRNIGATNVGRVVGKTWGRLCLLLDVLKGLIPTLICGWLLGLLWTPSTIWDAPLPQRLAMWVSVGLAGVLGHVFPIYLGFRGGKGVSTTIGVALGIYPYFTVAMIVALAAFGLARLLTGLTSVGSLCIALVFPMALYAYTASVGLPIATAWPLHLTALLLALLIIVRHRSNIARIWAGQELRSPQ